MKTFKVLGSGCKNCQTTAALIEERARILGVEVSVEKITDMATILGYGLLSPPGVVMDEKLVSAGGVPDRQTVEDWLSAEHVG